MVGGEVNKSVLLFTEPTPHFVRAAATIDRYPHENLSSFASIRHKNHL